MSSAVQLDSPADGSIRRASKRATVDFPEPDSPTMPSVSPLRTSRSTASAAFTRRPLTKPAAAFEDLRESTRAAGATRRRSLRPVGLRGVEAGDGLQQHPRVGMLRDRRGRRRPARTPPAHPPCSTATRVGNFGDDAEVVRDEQHGRVALALQIADEMKDLGLRGDVQRRGRLIGDEQRRFEDQRHGDHDALALPAGELVRIGRINALGIRQPHVLQHVQHAPAPVAGGLAACAGPAARRSARRRSSPD